MINPFSRLKHFVSSEIDPQENHATECLAGCLVLSPSIRHGFLDFLFGGELPFGDNATFDVTTQESIRGGYIDLILRAPEILVAVEVKVKAPEDCTHHREQLQKYGDWLRAEPSKQGYLFTLVKNPDQAFDPVKFGVHKRHSWRSLCIHFGTMLQQLSEVEANLLKNFCEYLEMEGIVSSYQTTDLIGYSAGLKAEKAVAGIFNQVDDRLRREDFESIFVKGKEDRWPQLRISNKGWPKIFGKGKNQRLSLWFTVPGVWEAKRHDFFFEIELWEEDQGADWRLHQAVLKKWFEQLSECGFEWSVYETWNRSHRSLPARQINFVPKRIDAYKVGKQTLLEDPPQSEDKLIALLVTQAREYSEVLRRLGDREGKAPRLKT